MSRSAKRESLEKAVPINVISSSPRSSASSDLSSNKSAGSTKSEKNKNEDRPASSTPPVTAGEEKKGLEGARRKSIIRTKAPSSAESATPAPPKAARRPFKIKANFFSMDSTLDTYEIKRLGMRFRKLDQDNSGSLSLEEFMNLTDVKENSLANRVISIFDQDKNDEIDFKEFIEGISQFTLDDKESKLKFAFRIYDMDNDGYISNSDLFRMLQIMVGDNLKDTQLQQVVDKTILYYDLNGDGKISYQEFCKVVGLNSDVHKSLLKMMVDV